MKFGGFFKVILYYFFFNNSVNRGMFPDTFFQACLTKLKMTR